MSQHYCFTPKDMMKNRIPIKISDFSELIFVFQIVFIHHYAIISSKNKISSERVNKTNEFH